VRVRKTAIAEKPAKGRSSYPELMDADVPVFDAEASGNRRQKILIRTLLTDYSV
jgi:hypothetical protein